MDIDIEGEDTVFDWGGFEEQGIAEVECVDMWPIGFIWEGFVGYESGDG